MSLHLPEFTRATKSAFLILAIASPSLEGCAWTNMSTYRDPVSVGHGPLSRIAIFAVVGDLAKRQTVESLAVELIKERTLADAVRAIDLLPPTRVFTAEEAAVELTKAGADGALFIILTNAYVDHYQMPGTSTTTGFGSVYGGTIYYQGQTIHQPGAQFSKPREAHELKLADLSTGSLVWISSSFTRGNAFADDEVMADSMVKVALEELAKEGLLRPRPK